MDERVKQLGDAVATRRTALSDNDEVFDWSHNNEDVILPEQRATAVYVNNWGNAVIRQERRWPDEDSDPYMVIDHAHLPEVIAALQAIAVSPRQRAEPEPGKATGGLHRQ